MNLQIHVVNKTNDVSYQIEWSVYLSYLWFLYRELVEVMEACNGVFVRPKQMMSVRFQNSANIGRPRILPGNKTFVTFVYPGAKNIECKVH